MLARGIHRLQGSRDRYIHRNPGCSAFRAFRTGLHGASQGILVRRGYLRCPPPEPSRYQLPLAGGTPAKPFRATALAQLQQKIWPRAVLLGLESPFVGRRWQNLSASEISRQLLLCAFFAFLPRPRPSSHPANPARSTWRIERRSVRTFFSLYFNLRTPPTVSD